jgi:predicted GH43/DUF377 family glycosyl hydrolase
MIIVRNEGIILEKTDKPFENQAVLNPGCVEIDGITHMFYRAVHEGNYSTIGYCQLQDNKVIYRKDTPYFDITESYESHGLEDPRIVLHEDGNFYLFYAAYDGKTAQSAYAVGKTIDTLEKKGMLTPAFSYDFIRKFIKDLPLKQKYVLHALRARHGVGDDALMWEKDFFLFPRKINGKYALVHRILPSIQIIYFDTFEQLNSLEYWHNYFEQFTNHIILDPREGDAYVGGGCPPIETKDGWLFIYHRVIGRADERMYCAGAALLDLNDPTKVISKLKDPFFYPQEEWELNGDVNRVVFPTGTIMKDDRLYIYYGAADTLIAAKSVILHDLLNVLKDPSYSHIYDNNEQAQG